MHEKYMTYEVFVASALAGGALLSGLVGITLLRGVATLAIIAIERKRGQARDNVDASGDYTGTVPDFRVAMTSFAAESAAPPSTFIECEHARATDADYENYRYKEWLFPRSVSFHFINYPRGLQGETEDRRQRQNRPGAPPAAPPPTIPGTGGGGTGPGGGGTGIPAPPPKRPPKDPIDPGTTRNQADFYQKSNLYQRQMKTGETSGRKYASSLNNPLYTI